MPSHIRFAALVFVAHVFVVPGGSAPALAQSPTSAGTDALVNGLLDQYAPGVRDRIAESRRLAADAAVETAPAPTLALDSPAVTSPDAARARAQSFLDQYAPGTVTLGARGVRVEVPGTVVDTRGTVPKIDTNPAAPAAMLHRLALLHAAQAFRTEQQDRADRWIDAVALDLPRDPDVRQMQSLIRLRSRRVVEAAEAARAALQAGPAWSREQLLSLFPHEAAYEEMYLLLRAELRKPEPDAYTLFVLAYHERMLGRLDEAHALLDRAAEQLPEDFVTPSVHARFHSE